MSTRKLFPNKANDNRVAAGSKTGIEGRKYRVDIAKRLNTDKEFRRKVCKSVGQPESMFLLASAGKDIPSHVENVVHGGRSITPKTSLQIKWRDGSTTNFHVTTSKESQIHLAVATSFIDEFSAQFNMRIPKLVKTALTLFCGSHPNQKEILASVPVERIGKRIRQNVEVNYFHRMTLASMWCYDEDMAKALLKWFRKNCVSLFLFCFSRGAAKGKEYHANFMWYKLEDGSFRIFDIFAIAKVIEFLMKSRKVEICGIGPSDKKCIGSTIAFPFGKLQQHENKLQFRHDLTKIASLSTIKMGSKHFGSRQKESGHKNEIKIVEELNGSLEFREHFCEQVGMPLSAFVAAAGGGKHAPKVPGVLGIKTQPKADVVVMWKDGSHTNVSIKKSPMGQAYLVKASDFANVYEAQYCVAVPSKVRRALELFVGEALDCETILDATDISVDGEPARDTAKRHHSRLVFEVIRAYDSRMAKMLLDWLKAKIVYVCELTFAAGAVMDRDQWAHILWYKNLVDVDKAGLDYLVPIKRIMDALERNAENNIVQRGPKNAGSTILLPFGHLQYHQRKLEFYQHMKSIQSLNP